MSTDLVRRAREIAASVVAGELDKTRRAYVGQVHRVADKFPLPSDEHLAALLRDVIEDGDWTLDDLLAAGFPAEVVQAVDALTKRPGESGMDAAIRAKPNPIARAVKLAENADDIDLSRGACPADQDPERLAEFTAIRSFLLAS